MGSNSLVKEKLDSLISIKKILKKYGIDDPIQFSAISSLNDCFKKYIYSENDIITTIPFNEFNRNIDIKLYSNNPKNNVVKMVRIQ